MPSLVNRVPPGLLSLLGIKAGGQNPAILPDTLQPTLELLELYVSGNAVDVDAATSLVVNNGVWAIGTPAPGPGEIYLVERMSVTIGANLAAGTTYRVVPTISDAVTAGRVFPVGPEASATAGQRLSVGSWGGFVLPSGFRLGLFAAQVTLGTAVQMSVAARYVPLSI